MKAILFLYEGETEGEFYNDFLNKKLSSRPAKLFKRCMVGVYNMNRKVVSRINFFLEDKSNDDVNALYVFVACDREGPINQPPPFSESFIRGEFKHEPRVKQINFVTATQDLESWLFHDIENIYKFLKTPTSQRSVGKYKAIGSLNNKDLSHLFKQNKKVYRKGHKVAGFLNNLDLDMIFSKCSELIKAEKVFNEICKIAPIKGK